MKPWEKYQQQEQQAQQAPDIKPWEKYQREEEAKRLPLSEGQERAVAAMQADPDKGGLANFITGNDRSVPGIEEIDADQVFGNPFTGEHPAENFKTSAGLLMTFDDDAKKNIWTEQMNKAGVEHRWAEDPFGNAVLVYQDPESGTEKIG